MEIKKKSASVEFVHIRTIKNKYFFLKRLMDIILSSLGLILCSIFFVIIAVIIKLDDFNGPVFFQQKRVGEQGKVFRMYKFRSMHSDAEQRLQEILKYNEIEGPMFKMKDDPRITKVGKFIRQYSIDELPQLYNVLKGDMSLIGPRPALINEVEQYTDHDKKRLTIKPGITGLWQVSGRSLLSFDQMIELDLQYINNVSLNTDVYILLKTIKVVFKPIGAY